MQLYNGSMKATCIIELHKPIIIMELYNWFMELQSCFTELHNWLMVLHNSIIVHHKSVALMEQHNLSSYISITRIIEFQQSS